MIYGKRLRLRGVERQDLPRFVEWLNDPEVRQGLLLYLPMSLVEEENWFEDMLKRPPYERTLAIEIELEDDWLLVGSCGFDNFDWRCRCAEVGIFIGEKRLWDQGYGSEVMHLLLRHGFETLNLNRISLDVYENNPRAIHVYEKLGFVQEGRKRQGMFKDGQYLDVLVMSFLHEEWQTRPSNIDD